MLASKNINKVVGSPEKRIADKLSREVRWRSRFVADCLEEKLDACPQTPIYFVNIGEKLRNVHQEELMRKVGHAAVADLEEINIHGLAYDHETSLLACTTPREYAGEQGEPYTFKDNLQLAFHRYHNDLS